MQSFHLHLLPFRPAIAVYCGLSSFDHAWSENGLLVRHYHAKRFIANDAANGGSQRPYSKSNSVEKLIRILAIIMALPLALNRRALGRQTHQPRWAMRRAKFAAMTLITLECGRRGAQFTNRRYHGGVFRHGFLVALRHFEREMQWADLPLCGDISYCRLSPWRAYWPDWWHDLYAPTIWLFVAIEAITVFVWLAHHLPFVVKNMKS